MPDTLKPCPLVEGRKEVTQRLSLLTEKYINPHNDPRIYWAREVTFDYASAHPIRVDYMKFKPVNNTVSGIEKGDFYCYEVKSSVEDFKSKNGHNFIGDFNYYVMTDDVYEEVKATIPYHVGVLTETVDRFERSFLSVTKKARRKDRARPVCEMLLMMFRSSKRDTDRRVGEGEKGCLSI